jgi:hypothetical protein
VRLKFAPTLHDFITCAALTLITFARLVGADEGQAFKASLDSLLAAQHEWGSKMSTPGATISLRETSRGKVDDHTVVRYRIVSSGLPRDQTYSLVMWQLGGQPQVSLVGVSLDQTGLAVCAGRAGTCGDRAKSNDPIDLVMFGGLGETKRFGLIASDKKARAFASVVPFPNRASDAECTLEATLVTPQAEAVMLFGSGFKAGARLDLEIRSEGETQHPTANANEKGIYEGVILPFRKGFVNGRTQASIHSGNCSPAVSFSWGADSYVLQ